MVSVAQSLPAAKDAAALAAAKTEIKKGIATYLSLTVLFCTPIYYLCMRTQNIGAGFRPVSYSLLVMWGPGLAALLTCRLRSIPLKDLGWKWQPTKYQWMAYGVP